MRASRFSLGEAVVELILETGDREKVVVTDADRDVVECYPAHVVPGEYDKAKANRATRLEMDDKRTLYDGASIVGARRIIDLDEIDKFGEVAGNILEEAEYVEVEA